MVVIKPSHSSSKVSINAGNTSSTVQSETTEQTNSLESGSINYWNKTAKEWAIKMDGQVEGTDYSSKYWAKDSATQATLAGEYLEDTREIYTSVQSSATEAVSIISEATTESLTTINDTKTESLSLISEATSDSIGSITETTTEVLETIIQATTTATEAATSASESSASASASATEAARIAAEVIESAPRVTVTETATGATINVEDIHGTSSADIDDGFSPSANVEKVGNKATITITDKDGTTTADIYDGSGGASSFSQLEGSPYDNPDLANALDSKASITYVDTADNNLQTQIDAITSQSDVTDVVGTYAELEAYDKPLYVGDIIKVLNDSTQSGARSYYRNTGGTSGAYTFTLIGSESPSYTKAESDALLQAKQNITDNTLTTTSKTIVGAINEVNADKYDANNPDNFIDNTVNDLVNYKNNTILEPILDNKLNKQMITNCLTEIPQKLKLELNNGTLTLKAGSKVIVPNGFESDGVTLKFDEVEVEEDLTTDVSTLTTQKFMVFANSLCTSIIAINLSQISTVTEDITSGSVLYYNTTTNLVKRRTSSGNVTERSFPIALSSNTAIDQTFNGIGYIGSTVFVDKGVKGLIPNGRNADGSLKNIEFETEKVLTITTNRSHDEWIGIDYTEGICSVTPAMFSEFSYYSTDNYVKRNSDGALRSRCLVGTMTTTNGVISNFKTYPAISINSICDGQWVQKFLRVASGLTAVGSYSYDISSYLPNDGEIYEILGRIYANDDGTTSGANAWCAVGELASPFTNYQKCISTWQTVTDSGCTLANSGGILIFPQRTLYAEISGRNLQGGMTIYLYGYRRLGTNN